MSQFIKKVTTKKFFVKVKSEEEAWKIVHEIDAVNNFLSDYGEGYFYTMDCHKYEPLFDEFVMGNTGYEFTVDVYEASSLDSITGKTSKLNAFRSVAGR